METLKHQTVDWNDKKINYRIIPLSKSSYLKKSEETE